MIPESFILLGRISKVHGFEGSVTVKTELNLSENIPCGEPVLLEIEGKPVPFFTEYSEIPRQGILNIKFDDYNDPDKIREFIGCRVFIKSRKISVTEEENYSVLKGYKVLSETGNTEGTISDVILNPAQVLIEIAPSNGPKFLLPLHENLIIKVDKRKKEITVELPEGIKGLN